MGRLCRGDLLLQWTVEPCLADFSLKFQNIVFDIIPSSLFLLIALFRILNLRGQKPCHPIGSVLGFSKVVGSKLFLLALQLMNVTLPDCRDVNSSGRLGISRRLVQI